MNSVVGLEDVLTRYERMPHKGHQFEGLCELVLDVNIARGRVLPKVFALFDQVGAAKSKQVIDASQILFGAGEVDTMVVVAPGHARSTWASDNVKDGEVAKHAWDSVHNVIHEYHARYRDLEFANGLQWIVTNYEFIRREEHCVKLIKQLKGRRVWMVLDESWAVKGFSDQMRACRRIRNHVADRVTLLNGTPLSDGKPLDLYYQMAMLDGRIIGAQNIAHFKSMYCEMDPTNRTIIDYKNLDQLNAKIAPYVLNRQTRDHFDLPPMLDPIVIPATLSEPTWKTYVTMRDDLVAFLDDKASVAKQAFGKTLRLSQITSGYLGGLEEVEGAEEQPVLPTMPDWLAQRMGGTIKKSAPIDLRSPAERATVSPKIVARTASGFVQELSREKLDAMIAWLLALPGGPPVKLLIWCKFRPELERTTEAMRQIYPTVLNLKGGQTHDEREAARLFLAPPGDGRPGCVVGNQQAGGSSLNFSGAAMAIYLSQGPSLKDRNQTIGRIERPGAQLPMQIVDVVATGPRGQKTHDHHVRHSLINKENMARWTGDQWRAWARSMKGV